MAQDFQEIEMNGTIYEFPTEMKDEEIGEVLQKEGFQGDGKADASEEIAKDKRPRGIRANNPGNIKFSKKNKWEGQTGLEKHEDPTFAAFDKPESGMRAMVKLLHNYSKRGQKTLDTIFRGIKEEDGSRSFGYAPDTENDTDAYIKSVSKRIGKSAEEEINVRDFETMSKLLPAMVQNEQGYNPFDQEMYDSVLESEGIVQEEEEVVEEVVEEKV